MAAIWTHRLENAPKRVNHAAAAIDHLIYSFGGYSSGDDYQSKRDIDIHRLDTFGLTWSLVKYRFKNDKCDVPFQRYGHTVVAHERNIYLWGGRNDEGACNELFKFDTLASEWTRIKTNGLKPKSRDGHSATVVGHEMFIFGGFEDETERFSNDVHKLDLVTFTWTFVQTRGHPPIWRDFHTSSVIGNSLLIFGGRSDTNGPFHTRSEVYDNSIYKLDLTTETWTRLKSSNDPIGRRSHSAFVYKNRLYIFGGFNGLQGTHYNDLLTFDPVSNGWSNVRTQILSCGPECVISGNRATGDAVAFRDNGIGVGPSPRRRQSCCLIGSKLYLFGGTSPIGQTSRSEFLPENRLKDQNDLHVLDFDPSLGTLSKLAIVKNQLDTSELPEQIMMDIEVIRGDTMYRNRSSFGAG